MTSPQLPVLTPIDHDAASGHCLCPSAQPEMSAPVAFAVVAPAGEAGGLAYLDRPVPATAELLSLTEGLPVGKVFRIAAACEERRCAHFDGAQCRLAQRLVELLPIVVDQLPACSIRNECRWYDEQGAAACQRCPQILTQSDADDDLVVHAALGTSAAAVLHGSRASDSS